MTKDDPLLTVKNHCVTCNRQLDNPEDPLSMDCGDHCVKCMADAGDPECIEVVNNITQEQR